MNLKTNSTSKMDPSYLSQYKIVNFKEPSKSAMVVPLSLNNQLSDKNIAEIVAICNQAEVYDLLFKEKLNGGRYEEKDARSFVAWANQGWVDQTHFVFLIKNESDKVIGAVDIKSNDPESSEVGYWQDKNSSGYMTNAVIGLIKLAKKAGYRNLTALTKLNNEKSKNVLTRAGFKFLGQVEIKPDMMRDKFVLSL